MAKKKGKPEERMTGLDVVPDVPWGTHFCLFYQTQEDLLEILVPYFKAGLESNEFCIWVTSAPLGVEEAKESLRAAIENLDDYIEKGQMEILDYRQWYTKSGKFEADKVLQGWVEKEDEALKRGFDGLRLTGNTLWLEKRDWKEFADYEAWVDQVIGEHRMLAICAYSLDKCGASEIMDVVSNHQFAVIRREGKWQIIENAERKRAEEARRESEERYRTLFGQSRDAVYITSRDGRILDANRSTLELFGYTREEFMGLLAQDTYLDPTQRRRYQREIEKKGGLRDYEVKLRKKDGTEMDCLVTATVRRARDGSVAGYQGIIRDITERKRGEEALRESEELYRAIFEQAADSIVLIDAETGALVGFNDRAHQNLRYTREEFRKLKIADFEVIESAEEVAKHIEKVIREGADTFETKHRTKDGEIRDILVSARAISIGGRDFLQATWRDVTERKRAEEEIRRRSKELAALYDISLNVAAQLEIEQLLQTIVEQATRLLDAKAGGIYLYDPVKQEIELQVSHGFSKDYGGTRLALGEGVSGKVAQTGEPMMVDDYQRWESRSPIWEGEAIGGVLGVPLKRGDDLLGVLTIDHAPGKTFQEGDSRLATLFANQAAIAIENARLYEETRHKAEELTALYDISLNVAAQLEIEQLLQTIVEQATRLLDARGGGIYFYDPAKQELELRASYGYFTKDYTGTQLALGEGLSGRVAQSGEPLVVEDYAHWEARSPKYDGEPSVTVLGVPLKRGDELLGVLFINHEVEKGFDEAEIRLATLFANQAAIAIQNARLYEEEQRRAKELGVLNAIAMTVISTLDLQEVLQTIQERVMNLLGEKYAPMFALFNQEHETFEVVLTHVQEEPLRTVGKSMGVRFEELVLPLSALDPAIREALLAGKPYVTDDGSDLLEPGTSRRLARSVQRALGIKSIVDLPLRVKGRLVGTMLLFSQKERLPDEEIGLLSAIAHQAAIAIENARLYEQTDEKLQHRVAELTALNTIAGSLTGTLELDETLESIVTPVAQVMRARICTIRLMEGDELTIGAALGYKDESARQHRIKIDPRLARIVQDHQPLMVEDLWEAEDIPPSRRERAKREGVHSFLGVPMICKGETIGILSIYGEKPRRFTDEEVRLLSTIANQAAIAIENARLYERVRQHAESLERLVEERTKELRVMQAELLQSAKLAALGQLAAGVAHELNNPLGAISGYLGLLQEEVELGSRGVEYVERIEKRIQQATKIVRELRTTWMPSEPAWQIADVNDILEETLALVERGLSLHQIKVQKETAPDLPHIHADPDRLQQVFINLITNARQAMEEGGILRVISRESRNGEWVEIIFADTGEGIAKEHLDKIFDPFFTTRSPGKGMGLGLSVSHRHIKDHGGAIDVWSEKGKGAVFRIALPPSGAKRCWEILDCDEKERCIAVRGKADYRCWSVMEDVSRCQRCEVYRRKALPPLDETLLPQ